jgi:hypothetical protein
MMIETEPGRGKRRRQRVLFDSVAELYDAVRPVYPDDAVDRAIVSKDCSNSAVICCNAEDCPRWTFSYPGASDR